MKKTVLSAKNVCIGYEKHKICSDINFNIFNGEMIGLLGRNGSGKSTLLKTLANMLPIISGDIKINKKKITLIKPIDIAKSIAVVLTEKPPENNLTCYDTIALGRQPYTNWLGKLTTEDKNIIKNSMLLTNTIELKSKLISELSDGQLQRVMIARALTQDSSIIILDEPTSHLDIHHKINVFKILKRITRETNKTVIISSHEINLTLKHTDKLMLINDNNFTTGNCIDKNIQDNLMTIFNSNDIKYDTKSNQFIF